MFLLLDLVSSPTSLNYKASPEDIIAQREEFPDAVFPGFHMNKKHWNTVRLDARLPEPLLQDLVRHAHALVHPDWRPSAAHYIREW